MLSFISPKINFKNLKINKNNFFKKLLKKGIKLQVHYVPIYRHSYYKKKFNLKPSNFPNTENFYNQVVSIPIYFNLKKNISFALLIVLKNIYLKNNQNFQ